MLLIIKKDSRDNLVYTLALNNGCLRSIQKGEYFIDVCHNENSQFHFNLIEIDSIVAYNEHILNSGNATNKDLIHRLDKSISYPFYILSPTNTRGYAVSYQNNNIYIKPLRNDVGQRFAIKRSSSVC